MIVFITQNIFFSIECMIEPLIKLNCGDLDHKPRILVSDLNKVDGEDGKREKIVV